MGARQTLNRKVRSGMRITAALAVLLALLIQGIFFYCLLGQYDTYGEPGYTYPVSYEEWLQMIEQAQGRDANWFLDHVIGIDLAVSLAMGILFVVFVRRAKAEQISLRGVKQTVIGACLVYAAGLLFIRLTAEQFRLYMNFTAAEVIALALLIFFFLNRTAWNEREEKKWGEL